MANHINFTSTYNPNLEAWGGNETFDPLKMNAMFSQILGNIAAVESSYLEISLTLETSLRVMELTNPHRSKLFLTQRKKVIFYYSRRDTTKS